MNIFEVIFTSFTCSKSIEFKEWLNILLLMVKLADLSPPKLLR